jgi:hypothetical protein
MFRALADRVGEMVGRLQGLSEGIKADKELAREIRHIGEDLSFLVFDFRDTLERLP